MVEAIIFDMDGVLFDTEKYYYDRRASFLAQKGISIDHLPPSFFIGGNTKQVWENILRDDYDNWDVPTLQEEYNAYKQDNPLPYKELIFPDVLKVLNEVKSRGLKIGLASSSVKADILRALKENHLDVRSSYHVVDDLSTVVMVANGFGICLMPEMVMKDIPYEVDCFPVKPDACRIIGIAALNPDNMAPAVRTFYNRVLAMYQQEDYVK